MAGLLDTQNINPLALGLLGAGGAIMSGRRGLAQAPQAFAGGLMQGQQMQQAQRAAALREQMAAQQMDMQRQQFGMQQEKFGLKKEEFARRGDAQRAEAEAKAQVGEWIAQNRPELLPAFRLNPEAVAAQLMPAKPQGPMILKPGDGAFDPVTGRPLFNNPKEPEMTPFERQLRASGVDPQSPQGRDMMAQYLRKQMTHAPAASQTVYTGTMVPAEVGGKPAFVMPGKDGSAVEIPGVRPAGTAQAEKAAAAEKRDALDQSRRMVSTVDEALAKINKFSTGSTGAVMSRLPATDATDLRKTIDTLKGNLAFETLRAMRAASPTGGALGAVSERELALLESTVASLDPNQSADQLRANLNKVKQNFERVRKLIESGNGQPAQGAAGAVDLQEMARQELLRRGGAR